MTWLDIIGTIGGVIFGIVVAVFITGPKLVKAIKARKNAKTNEEKAVADADIKNAILDFVVIAEDKYDVLNTALKNLGESGAGEFKKTDVMSATREYCDEHGYVYDKTMVSEYIDKVVDITKKLNK